MLIPIRVKPAARRASVGGSHSGRHGPALIVAVREPAVDGRATASALRAVAAALGLRPASVTLHSGAAGRDKLVAVTDPPPDLAQRLDILRRGPG